MVSILEDISIKLKVLEVAITIAYNDLNAIRNSWEEKKDTHASQTILTSYQQPTAKS